MKLIFAVVNRDDAPTVSRELSRAGFSSTQLASTGGFLRAGNTTVLAGVEEDKLQEAIDIIKEYSKSRQVVLPASPDLAYSCVLASLPTEVTVGGATIFVVDVDRFERA